jgi:MFS family permease
MLVGPRAVEEMNLAADSQRGLEVAHYVSVPGAISLAVLLLLTAGAAYRMDRAAAQRGPVGLLDGEGPVSDVAAEEEGEPLPSPASRRGRGIAFATVYFCVFVDMLGYGLILPSLPGIAVKYGANGFLVGVIMAAFSFAQAIGSVVCGKVSDKIGRRPVLNFCLFGSVVSLLTLGMAKSLLSIILLRALAGGVAGTIGTAQAYISDLTHLRERTKFIGLVSACAGLGVIAGPAIGGLIGDFRISCFVGAGITFLNFLLALVFLKESKTEFASPGVQESAKPKLSELLKKNPSLLWVYLSFFMSQIGYTAFASFLVLYLHHEWQLGPRSAGLVLMAFGSCMVVTQIFLGALVKRIGEKRIVSAGCFLRGLALIAMVLAGTQPLMITMIMAIAVSGSLIQPCLSAMVSFYGTPEDFGILQGTNQAGGAVARAFTPLLCGVIYDINRNYPFSVVGATAMFVACLAVLPANIPAKAKFVNSTKVVSTSHQLMEEEA